MKKYLFLLFLLLVYFILILKPKTTNVLSYEDIKKDGVVTVMLDYKNGINSNSLITLLDDYNGDYYVSKLEINDADGYVSCSNIKKCIDDVFEINDTEFSTNYMASGFKINKAYLIVYKDEIENSALLNDVIYNFF